MEQHLPFVQNFGMLNSEFRLPVNPMNRLNAFHAFQRRDYLLQMVNIFNAYRKVAIHRFTVRISIRMNI